MFLNKLSIAGSVESFVFPVMEIDVSHLFPRLNEISLMRSHRAENAQCHFDVAALDRELGVRDRYSNFFRSA